MMISAIKNFKSHSFLMWIQEQSLERWLAYCGLLILCGQPVLWLVTTWIDPAYDSSGLYIALLVAGLFIWSVTSPRIDFHDRNNQKSKHRHIIVIALLCLTSLLRIVSQLLAINIIGAFALVVDVFALATLAKLNLRARPISPIWLACLFTLSMPLSNLCQRTLGYGLQQLSATLAGGMLSSVYESVSVVGTQLTLGGQEIWVDLPCAGTQSITFLLVCLMVVGSLKRLSIQNGLIGLVFVLLAALIANSIRISFLAVGIAYPEQVAFIPVMEPFWHNLLGMSCLLFFGLLPLWNILNALPYPSHAHGILAKLPRQLPSQFSFRFSLPVRRGLAILFLFFAIWVVQLPHHPVDVSQNVDTLVLPAYMMSTMGKPIELSVKEKNYFTRYGGQAKKFAYGNHIVMAVRTTAPLRHLHDPIDCLKGLGFNTKYIGIDNNIMPSAHYEAIDRQGAKWDVAITFVSDKGHVATHVSEVMWHWFQTPDTQWTSIERIRPSVISKDEQYHWDQTIFAALDIATQEQESFHNIAMIDERNTQ